MQESGIGVDNLKPGSLLDGRFEVLSKLGQGGMGVVYEAHHLTMKRSVALKLLRSDLCKSPEKLLRFKNEAKVVSTLDHPNIVRVHSVGVTEMGLPYIAMEMLRGMQLSEYIEARGPLSWEEALPLFIQIADALQYAHEKSIIHRDVKPSNIMLMTAPDAQSFSEADGAQVKLVDFGIAKSLMDGAPQLTRTNMLLGSVFYLSPGQLQGRAPDARSDIYSLGCTFYEILTGVPPFVGDTVFDTMVKQASEQAAPINNVNPQACVPDDLVYLIDWMMQKESAGRPVSMAQVAASMRSIAAGEPLKRTALEPSQRRGRQLPDPRIICVVLGVVMAVSVAMLLHDYPKNSLTPHQSQLSPEEAALLQNVREKRDSDFPIASTWKDIQLLVNYYLKANRYLEAQIVGERALKSTKKEVDKETIAQLQLMLGILYSHTARFDEAEDLLKKSAATIKELGHVPAFNYFSLAHLYFQNQQYEEASALTEPTLKWLEMGNEPEEANRFCREAVDTLCFQNEYGAADKLLQRIGARIQPAIIRRIQQAEIDCILNRPNGKLELDALTSELAAVHGPTAARFALARARVHKHIGAFTEAQLDYKAATDELSTKLPNSYSALESGMAKLQIIQEYLDMLRAAELTGVLKEPLLLLIREHKLRVKELNNRSDVPAYLLNNEYLPYE